MAVRFEASAAGDGLASSGTLRYGSRENVERLLLTRIRILNIPDPSIGTKGRIRIWSTNSGGRSNIRWRLLPDGGLAIDAERIGTTGGAYTAQWPYNTDDYTTDNPWATMALRIGGTPRSGRTDLWIDGHKITKSAESNVDASFAGGAGASSFFTDAACIANASIGDSTRGINALYEYFYGWMGKNAYDTDTSFIVPDAVAAALSRGVSPIAMGMPLADFGFQFDEISGIYPTGAASVANIQSRGFEPGLGLYTVWPLPIIAEAERAGAADELSVAIASPAAVAQTISQAEIAPLTAEADSPAAIAISGITTTIAPLTTAVDSAAAVAESGIDAAIATLTAQLTSAATTAEGDLAASIGTLAASVESPGAVADSGLEAAIAPLTGTIDSPATPAESDLEIEVVPASPEFAINSPAAVAQTIAQAEIATLTATVDSPASVAGSALTVEVVPDSPEFAIASPAAVAVTVAQASIQPLGTALDSPAAVAVADIAAEIAALGAAVDSPAAAAVSALELLAVTGDLAVAIASPAAVAQTSCLATIGPLQAELNSPASVAETGMQIVIPSGLSPLFPLQIRVMNVPFVLKLRQSR